MQIYWLYLLLGIIFEVLGTICMKLADGFSKLIPSVLVFVFYGACLGFLILVLKKIEVGIAYAIWAGVGTALIAIIGFVWFKEPISVSKVISILLIIAGILGLELL
ncbi:MAG: DMT family transporter [Bacteroidia bacterium]